MPYPAERYFCDFRTQRDYIRGLELFYWSKWETRLDQLTPARFEVKPFCPHCDGTNVTPMRGREPPQLYQCNDCGCRKQFNVFTRTVFSKTRIPLQKWFYVYYYKRIGLPVEKYAKKLRLKMRDARALAKKVDRLLEKDSRVFYKVRELFLRRGYGLVISVIALWPSCNHLCRMWNA